MMSNKLKDTEQTKRMKELAMGGAYFNCGEIYKLLNYKELHSLVPKIKDGIVKLKSKLVYGKLEITNEERFLENLDHYITYVKDTYNMGSIEQFLLIEVSLDNKYAKKCLLTLKDFHEDNNYLEYFNYFRRMFLYNIYNNILYFHSKDKHNEYCEINRAYNEIKNYDFDNDNDILVLERMVIDIVRIRNNNLFNAFDLYKKIRKDENIEFYMHQLEWVLSDYYNNNESNRYIRKRTDHLLVIQDTTILFNVYNKKKNNEVEIEFGILNKLISTKTSKILLRKKEFDTLYSMLEDVVINNKEYTEIISFVDSTLRFDFDYDGNDRYLDIIYVLPIQGGDFYNVSMGKKDMIELYELITKQIEK